MRPARRFREVLLLAAVVLLPVVGVAFFYAVGGSGRAGADEQARQAVRDLYGYRPWFEPVWSPPTPAAEAWLFLGQVAAGAAALCFAIARLRARRSR
jgi:cobalt/nickel transport protein